jgi:hypothetical protein
MDERCAPEKRKRAKNARNGERYTQSTHSSVDVNAIQAETCGDASDGKNGERYTQSNPNKKEELRSSSTSANADGYSSCGDSILSKDVDTNPVGNTNSAREASDGDQPQQAAPEPANCSKNEHTPPDAPEWRLTNEAKKTTTDSPKAKKTRQRAAQGLPAAYSDEFLAWWEVYPRKIGKAAAWKAYWAALKLATAEVLLEAAQAFAESPKGTGDKQFCPHPSTWLNQRRWEDDRREWFAGAGGKIGLGQFDDRGPRSMEQRFKEFNYDAFRELEAKRRECEKAEREEERRAEQARNFNLADYAPGGKYFGCIPGENERRIAYGGDNGNGKSNGDGRGPASE